jgi:hypothetical protein
MSIGGTRKKVNFEIAPKYWGLVEGKVVAVNPDVEEYAELIGKEVEAKDGDKRFEYLGESKDGNVYLRVDFWLEESKKRKREGEEEEINELFKVTFFLENKERENKEKTKKQYINDSGYIGPSSWADDPNNLPEWFKERDYRVAHQGEEEFYKFMRMWLSSLDYRDKDTILALDWKKLMRGNVKEIRDQINGEWVSNVLVMAEVETVEKEDGVKEYQRIYNGGFLSPYTLKYFRLVDYTNPEVVAKLKTKKPRELKPYERFVLDITNPEYGSKHAFLLKEAVVYNPSENFAASEKVISSTGPDY